MPHRDGDELAPMVQPHFVRLLKERPRLVDLGYREELLESLEETIKERRTADTIASRISHEATSMMTDSAEPVVRDRVKERLNKVNANNLTEI